MPRGSLPCLAANRGGSNAASGKRRDMGQVLEEADPMEGRRVLEEGDHQKLEQVGEPGLEAQ